MKLTAEITEKLCSIQTEEGFQDNKFIVFAFALWNGATVCQSLINSINLSTEELHTYLEALRVNGLMSDADERAIKKIDKLKTVKRTTYLIEAEEILSHLSSITKKDFSPTNPRLKRIQTLCKEGYGIKDFKAVNLYFAMKWTSPDMKNYVRPETLYNTKFVSRLEEARGFFESFNVKANEISKLCDRFHKLIERETYSKDKLLVDVSQRELCKELPMNLQQTMIHWLNKYGLEDVILVIEETVKSWSEHEVYKNYISITKILDEKFPDRLKVIKRKVNTPNVKAGQNKVAEWAKGGN